MQEELKKQIKEKQAELSELTSQLSKLEMTDSILDLNKGLEKFGAKIEVNQEGPVILRFPETTSEFNDDREFPYVREIWKTLEPQLKALTKIEIPKNAKVDLVFYGNNSVVFLLENQEYIVHLEGLFVTKRSFYTLNFETLDELIEAVSKVLFRDAEWADLKKEISIQNERILGEVSKLIELRRQEDRVLGVSKEKL